MARFWQKPVLFKYTVIACTLILVLSIAFTINSVILLYSLNNSYQNRVESLVDNAANYIEDILRLYDATALNIATNSNVRNLSNHNGSMDINFITQYRAIMVNLENLRITNDEVADVLVVYNDMPMGLTIGGTWSKSYLSYWENIYGVNLSVIDGDVRSGSFTTEDYIVFYNNLNRNTHVFVLFFRSGVESMLARLVPDNYGLLAVTKGNGDLTLFNSTAFNSTASLGIHANITLERDNGLVMRFYNNPLSYNSAVNRMTFMSMGIILSIIIISAFLLLRIKKALYDPLPEIIRLLDVSEKGRDEFTLITEAINRIHINLAESFDAVKDMNESQLRLAFTQLLTAEATLEIKTRINLNSRLFCALTVLFEDETGNKDALRSKSFTQAAEAFDYYQVYGINKYNVYFFFLDDNNEFDRLISWINGYMENEQDFKQCGISQIHNDLQNVFKAFEESQRAFLEMPAAGFIIQRTPAIYNSVIKTPFDGPKISSEHHNQLISSVIRGDIFKILDVTAQILEINDNAHATDKRLLMLYLYDTVCLLTGADGSDNSKRPFLENIYNLELLFSLISSDINKRMKSKGGDEILTWVAKNLHNDVSLSDLAKAMNMSYSYASRFFSQKTGMNFSEYLQKNRIENAISLLTETNMGIEEISEASGFMSVNTFFRVFKKYTGMPPGKYRELRINAK